jgi:hypothetical protein
MSTKQKVRTIQDRGENFRGDDGRLYLIRCYVCDPTHGQENYITAVASGQCAWCGWKESKQTKPRRKR